MPTRNVYITDHYDKFIDASIAAGRFTNASEAIRASLHLLERGEAEEQAKHEWLRNAAQEGINLLNCSDYTSSACVQRSQRSSAALIVTANAPMRCGPPRLPPRTSPKSGTGP